MNKNLFFLAALLVLSSCAARTRVFNPPVRMVVAADVADVRSEPKPRPPSYAYDPLQETQVLKGEPIFVLERRGRWARVECPWQAEFTHGDRWQGYPGWIEFDALTADLSSGRQLVPAGDSGNDLREHLLAEARRHLGAPYLWGGRSVHDPSVEAPLTGVDCSGLVNWSFLQLGRLVPRDAHEQFMKARKVEPQALEPGDLIFLAKADRPDTVVHVGFYSGEGRILEAPQSGEKVREIPFLERFGKELAATKAGDAVGDRVIYFGTLFEEDR